jgi:hypothetical protein
MAGHRADNPLKGGRRCSSGSPAGTPRFLQRVSPPGPTDEKLAATLGLLPAANGKRRRAVTTETRDTDVIPQIADIEEAIGGGGVGLESVARLFPAPRALAPADGPPSVKLGFPVPVPLMREVARLEVDLSRHLGRRVSNHEIAAAALGLLPGEPAAVADLLRRHAARMEDAALPSTDAVVSTLRSLARA